MDLSHIFNHLTVSEPIDNNITITPKDSQQKDKKTYGGGANTNKTGLSFEKKTCLFTLCKEHEFVVEPSYCISNLVYKTYPDYKLYCCSKNSFKQFVGTQFKKEMYREPDDAFIVIKQNGPTKVYIIEKKTQNQSGTIDEKLFAVNYYLADYKLNFGSGFEIIYILCLSSYLWNCIENPKNKNGRYNKWKNYKQLISPEIKLINGDNDYKKQVLEAIPELQVVVSN
jgi:hypothetical protein